MKKKILFILHLPPPIHGAAIIGKCIQDSSLMNDAFQCDYINLSTSTQLSEMGRAGYRKFFVFLKLYYKVLSAVITNRYDLCYLTINSKGVGYYKELVIVFILKLFGRKIVYHYHNKGVSQRQDHTFQNLLNRFQFKNSKAILLSPRLYNDVAKYLPRSRVYYCANGIPDSCDATLAEMNSERESKSIPEILFLSNMMLEKGVFNLLKASKILHDNGVKFKTIFVGDWIDINEADFNDFVITNGLEGTVFYEGKKFGKEKFAYLKRADIFIHPTLNDCFPLAVLEAMQYGLPVISAIEGGIPDIVDDQVTGFLTPKNDINAIVEKITTLLNNKELRRSMGAAGLKKFNQNYTLHFFEQNIKEITDKILNAK